MNKWYRDFFFFACGFCVLSKVSLQRPMSIHSSQDMEITCLLMDEWIRKCDIHTQCMIDSVIKRRKFCCCYNVGELGGHYAQWNKPDKDRSTWRGWIIPQPQPFCVWWTAVFWEKEVRGFLGDVNWLFFWVLPSEVDSRREKALTYILHLYVESKNVELIEQRLGEGEKWRIADQRVQTSIYQMSTFWGMHNFWGL